MIDVIMWDGRTRRQAYINPDDIQALRDVDCRDAVITKGMPLLRQDLVDGGDASVCLTSMRDFEAPIYLFHDAAQVARAIIKYKVLMQIRRDPVPVSVAESWYDPIKVDE